MLSEDPSMITLTEIVLTDFIFGASNVSVLGNVGQIRACNDKGKSQYKNTLQHYYLGPGCWNAYMHEPL